MSFKLLDMERDEIYHDRCVCLLLADCVRNIGAARLDARDAIALALHI